MHPSSLCGRVQQRCGELLVLGPSPRACLSPAPPPLSRCACSWVAKKGLTFPLRRNPWQAGALGPAAHLQGSGCSGNTAEPSASPGKAGDSHFETTQFSWESLFLRVETHSLVWVPSLQCTSAMWENLP